MIAAVAPNHTALATISVRERRSVMPCLRRQVRTGTGSSRSGMSGRDLRRRSQRSAIADCHSLDATIVSVPPRWVVRG